MLLFLPTRAVLRVRAQGLLSYPRAADCSDEVASSGGGSEECTQEGGGGRGVPGGVR